jgi:RNA polymerase sigma-70 factor, ECF subfamily
VANRESSPAGLRQAERGLARRLRSVPPYEPAAVPPRPASGVSDGELLVLCAGGDERAFEELYERYARAVLGLALGRLRDRGRAEDAVQETFSSIWRAARSYRPERGSGAAWLYAIARNAITDRWRAPGDLPSDVPDTASPEPGPDERAELAWRSFCVHRALEALPDQERTLIESAYWGGLSQSEIATRLEIPLGTVKTRTRSALARLANALEDDLR